MLLQVREEHPETRTVILTAHEDGDIIARHGQGRERVATS